ncbi:cbb3-type cytochrome c oxidase subunit I [Rickettsiaceae bacterium]|nr:cbb3-type cytochrome c oxidase subunit I [Rickettsiaceae bacterium]
MNQTKHPIMWLKNGITALAIAGLYSIILVILRTPQLSHFFTDKSMFKSSLVIHVNLSVLVWLLSITCIIWSYSRIKSGFEPMFAMIAFVGMAFMAFSPLYPESVPVMNNYVPMLENIFFVIGLALFGVSVLLLACQAIITTFMGKRASNYGERIIAIAKFTSAIMFVAVWGCFGLSFRGLDRLAQIVPLDIDFYYEMLFWSGGHLLQFIYTQMLMVVLLVLAEVWKGGRVRYGNVYEMLLALNFVLGLLVFFGHYRYDLADGSFKEFFTLHMIYTAGVVPTIFIATLLLELIKGRSSSVPKFIPYAFLSSILLFLSGGAIGAVISGINVTIPAHYHGSIVGISVAFMGLSYIYCFRGIVQNGLEYKDGVIELMMGDNNPVIQKKNTGLRLVVWQLGMITAGQILHVAGLAMAGGYGVLRKTPGGDIALSAKVYMGMVGGGGLIAIIGGLIFVYICAKNLYSNKKQS